MRMGGGRDEAKGIWYQALDTRYACDLRKI